MPARKKGREEERGKQGGREKERESAGRQKEEAGAERGGRDRKTERLNPDCSESGVSCSSVLTHCSHIQSMFQVSQSKFLQISWHLTGNPKPIPSWNSGFWAWHGPQTLSDLGLPSSDLNPTRWALLCPQDHGDHTNLGFQALRLVAASGYFWWRSRLHLSFPVFQLKFVVCKYY